MDAREERGLVIAATQRLVNKGKVWLVPSQTGNGKKYTVCPDSESPYCSCPDHEETGGRCKHIFAVEFVVSREKGSNGDVTETRTFTFTEKKTYSQNWPAYNLAQTTEKHRFQVLLRELCQGITEPPQPAVGRRRALQSDMVFMAALKVYTTVSSRRYACDLQDAHAKGYLTELMHPMSVCSFLENEALTPVLHELITRSAAPLNAVETDFAVDSSGFSTNRFVRWYDEKYGCTRQEHDWVKVHICTGVKTNVVTAVEIHGRDAADSPQFKPLVEKTAETFKIDEVSADKAYLSAQNVETVFKVGGTPYIAFKANSTGKIGGLFQKMFHYYSANRDDYMARYHKRSNVESTISMIKAKFRDNVRSKTDVAMRNEALCKILCHNICCLIHSQYELGIEPVFWNKEEPAPVTTVASVVAPTEAPKPSIADFMANLTFTEYAGV